MLFAGEVAEPEGSGEDVAVAARERADLDVGDVVLEPPAVRVPGELSGEYAEAVAGADGAARRDGRVQPEQVGLRRAGEVQPRNARQQHRDEIGSSGRRDVGQARIEQVDEHRHLGIGVARGEVGVVLRLGSVPEILLAERDDDLVDQRVTEA